MMSYLDSTGIQNAHEMGFTFYSSHGGIWDILSDTFDNVCFVELSP